MPRRRTAKKAPDPETLDEALVAFQRATGLHAEKRQAGFLAGKQPVDAVVRINEPTGPVEYLAEIRKTLTEPMLGQRMQKKYILSAIYALRSVAIVVFLSVPLTPWSVYIFSSVMGVLWWRSNQVVASSPAAMRRASTISKARSPAFRFTRSNESPNSKCNASRRSGNRPYSP